MKPREVQLYMDIARRVAQMSRCTRRQVGCVIVKDKNIISFGWNGTPSGEDNDCEGHDGLTKPNVIHAEDNALRKLVTGNENSVGAVVFITTAPCIRCAEKLSDAKVAKVYYADEYKNAEGIAHLHDRHDIEIELLEQE